MATLEIKNVSKDFGKVRAISNLSLRVEDGELVVFVGPSGCGKSTLLRMIAGLETQSAGEIWIDEKQIDHLPPAQRGISMVFQSYALYPHKNVRGNLGFALRHAKVDKAEINRRVDEAADILGLSDLMDRRPSQLSGGQRQRVAIGRAIVREPKVFLFDEPLSNLDAALRVHMRVEILKLHQRLKNTMVYVTHDQVEAMTLADRIVVFREGCIEQIGSPVELYKHPANTFVAGFIGSPAMNFLQAQADLESGVLNISSAKLSLNGANPHVAEELESANLTVGIRPEHLQLSEAGSLAGEVQVFEHLGGESFLHMKLADGQIIVAKLDGEHSFRPGQQCRLTVSAKHCHLFTREGRRIPRVTEN